MCSAFPVPSRSPGKSTRRPTPSAPSAPSAQGRRARLRRDPPWRQVLASERRAVARIEATALGLDIRFVVTSLEAASPEGVYARLYCARGQAENLIKLHKAQLASDRTSCRSALANQMRLILHTAAYWLMLTVRDAIPKAHALARAEFATLRPRLLKIAARIVETASRVRLAFAAACPDAALFACSARRADAARSLNGGAQRPSSPIPSLKRVRKCRSSWR